MKGNKPIRSKDIVSWISFGVTHLPRPEDFPVMPSEHLSLVMKPGTSYSTQEVLYSPSSQKGPKGAGVSFRLLLKFFLPRSVGFFRQNPALDVPASADIKSVNAFASCCAK